MTNNCYAVDKFCNSLKEKENIHLISLKITKAHCRSFLLIVSIVTRVHLNIFSFVFQISIDILSKL